ncbi:MAG: hypothetical protein LBG62_05745 [Candidatus Methanoplasma sp.]|nr:hypothetical protein [Candidatus Methanoplasma sp.]
MTTGWRARAALLAAVLAAVLACPAAVFASGGLSEDSDAMPGSGTEGDPYLISTYAQLDSEFRRQAGQGRHFALDADIALEGSWVPIQSFSGTLDGRGHSIRMGAAPGPSLSVFKEISSSAGRTSVSDLTVDVGSRARGVSAGEAAYGALACKAVSSTYPLSIEGCRVVGGLTINGSGSAMAPVSDNISAIGGLVGATVADPSWSPAASVKGCVSELSIAVRDASAAGFVAVGGLIGFASKCDVSGCAALGGVAASSRAGTSLEVGGLIGSASGSSVSKSYSAASSGSKAVSADSQNPSFTGGLIGHSAASEVRQCFSAQAEISASGANAKAGGLLGGIVGGSASQCYSAAGFSGAGKSYGFAGSSTNAQYSGCYFRAVGDMQPSPGSAGAAAPLSESEMRDRASFRNWDFADTWSMDPSGAVMGGYPYLSVGLTVEAHMVGNLDAGARIQYRIGGSGAWADMPGSSISVQAGADVRFRISGGGAASALGYWTVGSSAHRTYSESIGITASAGSRAVYAHFIGASESVEILADSYPAGAPIAMSVDGDPAEFSGAVRVKRDSRVLLAASPMQGHSFARWSGDPAGASNAVRAIVASEDAHVTALYYAEGAGEVRVSANIREAVEKPPGILQYRIQTGPGAYTAAFASHESSFSARVPAGASLEVAAEAGPGYRFTGWSDGRADKAVSVTAAPGLTSITALFATEGYDVRLTVGAGGSVEYSLSGSGAKASAGPGSVTIAVPAGESLEMSAQADRGSHFLKWGGPSGDSFVSRAVAAPGGSYSAHFEADGPAASRYAVSVAAGQGGSVEASGGVSAVIRAGAPATVSAPAGSAVYLSARADQGSHFLKWGGGPGDAFHNPLVVSSAGSYAASFEADGSGAARYVATVRVGENGSVSVSGPAAASLQTGTWEISVPAGSEASLRSVPASGYHFLKWEHGSGESRRDPMAASSAGEYSVEFQADGPGASHRAIAVAVGENGSVEVRGAPGASELQTGAWTVSAPAGASVRLRAAADAGHHFLKWSEGGRDLFSNPAEASSDSYSAIFEADGSAASRYAISVEVGRGGSVVASGSVSASLPEGAWEVSVPAGGAASLRASASPGFHFLKWVGAPGESFRNPQTASSAGSFAARFEADGSAAERYCVSVSVGQGGSVEVSGGVSESLQAGSWEISVPAGGAASLRAAAGAGHHFLKWSDGSRDLFYNPLSAPSAGSYSVLFESDSTTGGSYAVSVSAGPGGSVSVSGWISLTVPSGASVEISAPEGRALTLSASPSAGRHFLKWIGAQGDLFHNPLVVSSAGTYSASFEADGPAAERYVVTIAAGAGGSVKVSGAVSATLPSGTWEVSVPIGGSIAAEAAASSGHHFLKWGAGSGDAFHNPLTVSSPGSYSASFEQDRQGASRYNVSVTVGQGGSVKASGSVSATLGTGSWTVSVPSGGSVSLSAEASPGYHFLKWGAGSSDSFLNPLVVSSPGSRSASFEADGPGAERYCVTVTVGQGGSAGVSGAVSASLQPGTWTVSAPSGEIIVLGAKEGPGSHFLKWSDGSSDLFYDPVVASSPGSYSLSFEANGSGATRQPSIVTVGRNGSVAASGPVSATFGPGTWAVSIPVGGAVALDAEASGGYHFLKWSDRSGDSYLNPFSLSPGETCSASFEADGAPGGNYGVRIAVGPGGSARVSGAVSAVLGEGSWTVSAPQGRGVVLTAEASDGFHFLKWSDGGSDMFRDPVPVSSNGSYSLSFEADGPSAERYCASVSVGSNGSVGVSGSVSASLPSGSWTISIPAGGAVSLDARAASGHRFLKWSDGSADSPLNPMRVSSAGAYSASFESAGAAGSGYSVTVVAGLNGSVAVSGSVSASLPSGTWEVSVPRGGSVLLDARPGQGFHFLKWSDGRDIFRNPVSASSAWTYTASFEADGPGASRYNVAVEVGSNGSVEASGPVEAVLPPGTWVLSIGKGQSADLTAAADAGYVFEKWRSSAGDSDSPRISPPPGDACSASFAKSASDYSVTVVVGPGGSVRASGIPNAPVIQPGTRSITVPAGATLTLDAQPAQGYRFLKWSGGAGEIRYNPVSASSSGTYSASFEAAGSPQGGYSATIVVGAGGSAGVSGSVSATLREGTWTISVPAGGEAVVSSRPGSGYHFLKWSAGSADVFCDPLTVSSAGTYSLSFEADGASAGRYCVTVAVGASGSVGVSGGAFASLAAGTWTVSVQAGAYAILDARPDRGFHFLKWSYGSGESHYNPIGVRSAGTYSVSFEEDGAAGGAYAMTVVVGAHGSVRFSWASGGAPVTLTQGEWTVSAPVGAGAVLDASADAGHHFLKWSDGSSDSFVNPLQAVSAGKYEASFEEDGPGASRYNMAVSVGQGGSVTASGGADAALGPGEWVVSAPSGSSVGLDASPGPGRHFLRWLSESGELPYNPISASSAGRYSAEFESDSAADGRYTVSVRVGENGSVRATGAVDMLLRPGKTDLSVPSGSSVALAAEPDAGYHFRDWNGSSRVSAIDVGSAGTYSASFEADGAPGEAVAITVTVGVGGSVRVSGAPGAESLRPGTWVLSVPQGASLSMDASPDPGHHFLKWGGGAGDPFRNPMSVEAPASASAFSASFEADGPGATRYCVSVSVGPNGSASVSGAFSAAVPAGTEAVLSVPAGGAIELAAIPDRGHHFLKWARGSEDVFLNPLFVSSAGSYSASFEADGGGAARYVATVSAGQNGSVSVSGAVSASVPAGTEAMISVPAGGSLLLRAEPGSGCHFLGWRSGSAESFLNPLSVSSPGTYSASFEADGSGASRYSVAVAVGPNGSAAASWPGGSATLPAGSWIISAPASEPVSLDASPDPGYHFLKWSGGSGDTRLNPLYVSSAGSYSVSFEADGAAGGSYAVSISVGRGGSVAVSGAASASLPEGAWTVSAPVGEGMSLDASASAGHRFLKWSDGSSDVRTNPVSVSSTGSYSAHFEADGEGAGYSVTVSVGPNGSVRVSGSVSEALSPGTWTVSVPAGGSVALDAAPGRGHHFLKWSDGSSDLFRNPLEASSAGSYSVSFEADGPGATRYVASVSAGAGGSVDVSGSVSVRLRAGEEAAISVPAGGRLSLSSSADPGYRFLKWSDGTSDVFRDPIEVSSAGAYAASFAPEGAGGGYSATVHVGQGGSARVSGGASMELGPGIWTVSSPSGGSMRLEAAPAGGYHFLKWSDGSADMPYDPIEVSSAGTYYVHFEADGPTPSRYSVGVAVGQGGSVRVSGGLEATIPAGASVTLSAPAGSALALDAVADRGYRFLKWSDGAGDVFHNPLSASPFGSYSAAFESDGPAPSRYSVAVSVGPGGSVKASGGASASLPEGEWTLSAPVGSEVRLKAVPDRGRHFLRWAEGAADEFRDTASTSSAGSFKALFEADGDGATRYVVSVKVGPNGSVRVSGGASMALPEGEWAVSAPVGSALSLRAEAARGFHFLKWGDGSGDLFHNPVATGSPGAYEASFERDGDGAARYVATVRVGAHGSAVASGGTSAVLPEGEWEVSAPSGDRLALGARPDQGYRFLRWTDGSREIRHDPIEASAGGVYEVTFEAGGAGASSYLIEVAVGPGGSVAASGGATAALSTGSWTISAPVGSTVLLSAEPWSGHRFAKWGDGSGEIRRNPLAVSSAGSYSASFEARGAQGAGYDVTVAVGGGGRVIASGAVSEEFGPGTWTVSAPAGGAVRLEAVPDPGCSFVKWSDGYGDVASNPLTVLSDGRYEATFAPPRAYTVTVIADEGSEASPSGTVEVPAGGSLAVIVTAREGMVVASVEVDGVPVEVPGGSRHYEHVFRDVGSNHVVYARSAPDGAGTEPPGPPEPPGPAAKRSEAGLAAVAVASASMAALLALLLLIPLIARRRDEEE